MTALDIVKILRACRDCSIKSLKFEGLELSFTGDTSDSVSKESLPDVVLTEKDYEAIDTASQTSMDIAEIQTKEEYIEGLILEDPALYEKLITEGELTSEETVRSAYD